MHDPKELRDLARKCRQRANSTFNPTVTEQLRCWAAELADAADAIERTGCEPTGTLSTTSWNAPREIDRGAFFSFRGTGRIGLGF